MTRQHAVPPPPPRPRRSLAYRVGRWVVGPLLTLAVIALALWAIVAAIVGIVRLF